MGNVSSLKNARFLLTSIGLAACMVLYGEGLSISRHVDVDTFAIMATNISPLSGGITIIAAFIITALFARHITRLATSRVTLGALAAVNVLGMVMMLGGILNFSDDTFLPSLGGLVLGLSSTFLLICWADYLIPFGAKQSSLYLAAAFLVIALFDLTSTVLSDGAFSVLAVALCILSPYLLDKARNIWRIEHIEREIKEYTGVVPVWVSFSSIVLYAVLMGGIQANGPAMVNNGGSVLSFAADFAADFGMVIAMSLVLLGLRFLNGNNMSYYRLIILALICVSLYLSSFLSGGWTTISAITMTTVRMLIFVYVWTLFSTPAKTISPIRLFSVGWLLFLVPNIGATRLGQWALGDMSLWMMFGIGLACILLAVFILEFTPLFTDRYVGGVEHEGQAVGIRTADEVFTARIGHLVENGRLTPREQDVLVALARGRSAQYIADTFVVSKETARTHIRHVYQKLDVHSREELLDLVEDGLK